MATRDNQLTYETNPCLRIAKGTKTTDITHTINPGLFEKRFKELDELVHSYEALQQQLKREKRDLDERLQRYEEEREKFENERLQWKEELERKRMEMMEQNDRLTVLSEQLVGAKV